MLKITLGVVRGPTGGTLAVVGATVPSNTEL
jgi:hypothetical protein